VSLEWMAWTWPTAAFFATIALMLVAMTGLEVVWPTVERRGLLPIRTTRGDRLFIGLLGSAYLHLGWLAAIDAALWGASILALVWMAVMLRWG
jgi:predicted small integral membrane protein